MKLTLKSLFFVGLLIFWHPGVTLSGSEASGRQLQLVTDFSYSAGLGDTPETARALALYGAKHKAVVISAEQLADKGLLKDYEDRQMEVFCLVADGLQYSMIDQSFAEKSRTYMVKIKSSLSLADFIKAEIRDAAFEKEEMHFSWQEEMEPVVSPIIAPAQELSRAYRYIRKKHWRMAIIYQDHLEKKYPCWDALFLAKAMAYLGMNQTDRAITALSSSCYLGDQEACLKLNELDPSD